MNIYGNYNKENPEQSNAAAIMALRMIRKRISHTFRQGTARAVSFLLLLSALVSCSDLELAGTVPSRLSINAKAGDWNISPGTRAAYSAHSLSGEDILFPMQFSSGDAIGVFVTDATGKVLVANRKFQYDGSEWKADKAIGFIAGTDTRKFFAYYPWQASLTGAPAEGSTLNAASADEFFSDVVSSWTPSENQNTVDKFTGSDLMTAQGTLSDETISFVLNHRMGLMISAANMVFYDIRNPEYTWTVTQNFITNVPYRVGSKYYYLAKPGVETSLGAKKATLDSGQAEQLYFTNKEPGDVEYEDNRMDLCLGTVFFSSTPTYTYSTSTDDGKTWGSFRSTKPAWLTMEGVTENGVITKLGAIMANTKTTSISKGAAMERTVPADDILKSAASVSDVDLSMVDNAGNPRTLSTTANCYLIHAPGTYRIPLVYGNAIKNGVANPSSYLKNHKNTYITNPWLKNNGATPDGAKLVWEDVKGMVSSVGLSDNHLTFSVDPDKIAEGNIILAATQGNAIVWSWHIWVTPQTMEDLTTVNTGEHVYMVAPANVGLVRGTVKTGTLYAGSKCKIRATANNLTLEFMVTQPDYFQISQTYDNQCTYYQFGRKDPFPPGYGASSAEGNDIGTYSSTAGTLISNYALATAGYLIQNPEKWSYPNNGTAYSDPDYYAYNFWNKVSDGCVQSGSIYRDGNLAEATVKTIYDPCPPGFCVPTDNLFYYSANNMSPDLTELFPATGRRYSSSGDYESPSIGYYWSSEQYTTKGLYFYRNNNTYRWNKSTRDAGFAVRPVVEE